MLGAGKGRRGRLACEKRMSLQKVSSPNLAPTSDHIRSAASGPWTKRPVADHKALSCRLLAERLGISLAEVSFARDELVELCASRADCKDGCLPFTDGGSLARFSGLLRCDTEKLLSEAIVCRFVERRRGRLYLPDFTTRYACPAAAKRAAELRRQTEAPARRAHKTTMQRERRRQHREDRLEQARREIWPSAAPQGHLVAVSKKLTTRCVERASLRASDKPQANSQNASNGVIGADKTHNRENDERAPGGALRATFRASLEPHPSADALKAEYSANTRRCPDLRSQISIQPPIHIQTPPPTPPTEVGKTMAYIPPPLSCDETLGSEPGTSGEGDFCLDGSGGGTPTPEPGESVSSSAAENCWVGAESAPPARPTTHPLAPGRPVKAPESAQARRGAPSPGPHRSSPPSTPSAPTQPREAAERLREVHEAIVSGLGGVMGIDLGRVAQTGATGEAIARAAKAARSQWASVKHPTSFFLWHLRREVPTAEPADRRSGPRSTARAEWQRPLRRPDDRPPAPPTGAVLCISPPVSEEDDRRARAQSLSSQGITSAHRLSEEDRALRAKAEERVRGGDLFERLMREFPRASDGKGSPAS